MCCPEVASHILAVMSSERVRTLFGGKKKTLRTTSPWPERTNRCSPFAGLGIATTSLLAPVKFRNFGDSPSATTSSLTSGLTAKAETVC